MFDRETWLFINSFTPLLTALGTVAAVLVSIVLIYLYRRASRPDIRVSTSITSEPLPGKLFFRISVVNHSRKAVVKSIVWWCRGFGRRRQGWFVPPRNIYSYSTELPCDLDFAQEVVTRTRQGFKVPAPGVARIGAAHCSLPACWRDYEYWPVFRGSTGPTNAGSYPRVPRNGGGAQAPCSKLANLGLTNRSPAWGRWLGARRQAEQHPVPVELQELIERRAQPFPGVLVLFCDGQHAGPRENLPPRVELSSLRGFNGSQPRQPVEDLRLLLFEGGDLHVQTPGVRISS